MARTAKQRAASRRNLIKARAKRRGRKSIRKRIADKTYGKYVVTDSRGRTVKSKTPRPGLKKTLKELAKSKDVRRGIAHAGAYGAARGIARTPGQKLAVSLIDLGHSSHNYRKKRRR